LSAIKKERKKMKKILIIALVFIVGCSGSPIQTQSEAKKNRKAMISLSPGATQNDVLQIMGEPRKTELYVSKGDNIEYWFYLTEGTTSYNRRIIETNLTPLVFVNDSLIGWGGQYLDEHIKKYELRIR